ncbi:hypothetical protein N9N76_01525 [Flavobacteriaceae bacterium]|nr:hypothetical protein [Flavobacteriaceae bacterium]MDC0126127.1 hypothetical protein [Flavobacteriaceae bacterium]
MKILILHRVNPPLQGFVLLNLVYNQLAKTLPPKELEIDLILENGKDSSNLFYQDEWFKNIEFQPGFKDIWNRKNRHYDLVLNLTLTPFSLLYYYIAKGTNKQTLHWINRKKLSATNNYDLETALAKKMIHKISDKAMVAIDLPTLNIDKEKLNNTEKLIDWLLRSENLKPLSFSDYLLIYIEDRQNIEMIEAIEKIIYTVLGQKKFKVILVLERVGKSKEEIKRIQRLNEIQDKNFYVNFIDYNDLYYLVKFAEKSVLTITDSVYLNTIGEVKNWRMLYLENKKLNNTEMNSVIERVSYHLKNLSPL